MSGRRFALLLLLIAAGGFGLRVAYLEGVTAHPETHFYDWIFYRGEARALGRGHGFVEPGAYPSQPDSTRPAADHPPLLSILLAPVSKISHDSDFALRLFNTVVGSISVVLIGLLGREIAGRKVGLVAAAIAAVYPNLWVHDALIMPESITIALVTAAVLVALRTRRRPTLGAAIALGALCGLAALARSELVLLFPLLAIPVFVAIGVRAQPKLLIAATLAVIVVVGPWMGYNFTRFQKPVFMSTNFDLAILGSNCRDVQHGSHIGMLGFCDFLNQPKGADESVIAERERQRGLTLMKSNLTWFPVLVSARIGRTWSLFRPLDDVNVGIAEGRPGWVTKLGLVWYYPLLVLAAVGVWLRRRRSLLVWPLLVPPMIVTVTMLVSYGQNRLRVEAEPMIVVLAAQAVVLLIERSRRPVESGLVPATTSPATETVSPDAPVSPGSDLSS